MWEAACQSHKTRKLSDFMLLRQLAAILVAWSGEAWAEYPERAACLLQQSSTQRHNIGEDKPLAEKRATSYSAGHDSEELVEITNGTAAAGPSKNSEKKAAKDANDTASLRLELVLSMSLKQLQATDEGPLPEFLEKLRSEIVNAVNISSGRLNVLSVRGEYIGGQPASLLAASVIRDDSAAGLQQDEAGQSIIDLEVLPGISYSEQAPSTVATKLKDQLSDGRSKLMKGSLKALLQGAELHVNPGVQGLTPASACPQSIRFLLFFVVAFTTSRFAMS